jgi:hypothetical protein
MPTIWHEGRGPGKNNSPVNSGAGGRCRFSAGRDPCLFKTFPPDLSTRLSARRTPSACPFVIGPGAVQIALGVLTGWLDRREREAVAYPFEENRLPRRQLARRRLRLTDEDRRRLAARAYRVGCAVLREIATVGTADTFTAMASPVDFREVDAFQEIRTGWCPGRDSSACRPDGGGESLLGYSLPAVARVDQQRALEYFKEAQALCERDRRPPLGHVHLRAYGDRRRADADVRDQPAATGCASPKAHWSGERAHSVGRHDVGGGDLGHDRQLAGSRAWGGVAPRILPHRPAEARTQRDRRERTNI